MLVLEVQKKTLFIKLKDVYPECAVLIEGESRLHPLICLKSSCPKNANCMEKLAKRVKYTFEQWPESEVLLLYFTYKDRPESLRGGIFYPDMREPRLITFNKHSWDLLKRKGKVYEWQMPNELFL